MGAAFVGNQASDTTGNVGQHLRGRAHVATAFSSDVDTGHSRLRPATVPIRTTRQNKS